MLHNIDQIGKFNSKWLASTIKKLSKKIYRVTLIHLNKLIHGQATNKYTDRQINNDEAIMALKKKHNCILSKHRCFCFCKQCYLHSNFPPIFLTFFSGMLKILGIMKREFLKCIFYKISSYFQDFGNINPVKF